MHILVLGANSNSQESPCCAKHEKVSHFIFRNVCIDTHDLFSDIEQFVIVKGWGTQSEIHYILKICCENIF